jgi:hypothetical protein
VLGRQQLPSFHRGPASPHLDGERPALLVVLETIEQTKTKLETARKTLETLGEAFEFTEPDEDDLTTIRAIYERAVERES